MIACPKQVEAELMVLLEVEIGHPTQQVDVAVHGQRISRLRIFQRVVVYQMELTLNADEQEQVVYLSTVAQNEVW